MWQTCVSKPLKPLVYIGGGEGLALRLKGASKASAEVGGGTLTPIRFGRRSPFLPSHLLLFCPLIFLLDKITLLGWPHQPTKGWCATHGLLGSLPGGWPPPGKNSEHIRHSRYTIGNARNLSGGQMKQSYVSIFVSGPFRKPS